MLSRTITVTLTHADELNKTQKEQTTQNVAKQNYPGLVAIDDICPWNKVDLFYNALQPTFLHGVVALLYPLEKNSRSTAADDAEMPSSLLNNGQSETYSLLDFVYIKF